MCWARSCSTSNSDLQRPPKEELGSTDLHFTKPMLDFPLELVPVLVTPGQRAADESVRKSRDAPGPLYCSAPFVLNELTCWRQTLKINHNFQNAVRVLLFIF